MDGGFRATDALCKRLVYYLLKGSSLGAHKRRVDDPDDDEVAGDLLTGLSAHLQQLGVNQLLEAQNLGKKSALLETQLDSHPDPNLPDLERELTGSVFPKKLLVAGILAEDTAYEDLRPAMAECAAEQGFLLILLKEGLDFGRTPLSRYLRDQNIPYQTKIVSIEQEYQRPIVF